MPEPTEGRAHAVAKLGALRRLPAFWLGCALLFPAAVIELLPPAIGAALRYERSAINDGQVWRLVYGHFVHLGSLHFLLNALALVVLLAGFRWPSVGTSGARLLLVFLALTLGTSAGLLLWSPEVHWYVGLSGVLHGVVVLVAADLWRKEPVVAGVMGVGVFLKVAWEQLTGGDSLTAEAIGGLVVVDAHLYGALAAAALLAVEQLISAARKRV